jgi:hypothetical protein
MDLFAFMLTKIIATNSDKTIKEILVDMDVTEALLYLYQNNFYYLIDNGLIVNKSNSEDIEYVRVNEVSFTEFGKSCLGINKIPLLDSEDNRRVIYNPYKGELVSDNYLFNGSNVVVFDDSINYLDLLNKYKKSIVNRYDEEFVLNYSLLEADPFYFSVNTNSSNIDGRLKKHLLKNALKHNDNKEINEDKKEFLSNNFKIRLFYGVEENIVPSDYYLIVSEDKKYQVDGNKVYIDSVISEYLDYSFVEIERESKGYNVGRILIDNNEAYCFESFKLKDYKGDIKKYLLKNRDKYKSEIVINEIIDLL